ncbi:MAG: tetratricopeptide repeat protein [Tannerellaceae bacterium]|nr:tetratricopeptide repeat protein [Tannerellaceae bacterium]
MKKSFYYIISLFLLLLLWSCGTKKNTKASRFYNAFTTRYNIYYNGKTHFDQTLKSINEGYQESYAERIHMYPISAQPKDKIEPGGPFDRTVEKSNKAIKLKSIKTKPPKKRGWRNDPKQRALQEKEEYNPFLKNCWLLLGQAQFYNTDFLQAAATFSYIARHYAQEEEVVAEARLWQARCYSELNWFYEAEDILGKLNINGIPKRNLKQYAAVYADYLIKNQQFEEAVPYLQTAIKAEKNGHQRARMKYLLGQIYAEQGIDGMAYKMFNEVANASPPYELEFAARIRQTEVFSGANHQKVVKMLERMGKSDKNKDYLDQVYYALGNVYLTREDTVNAIKNYHLAIEKSTKHGLEKAICEIRLGDLYFTMREYVKAQPCFSGALGAITKEHKEYKRVSKLSSVLDELVIHVEAVQLQDSLQTLARMPETERLAAIDKIIEQVIKEEEQAKAEAEREAYLADQEARGTGINRPGTETASVGIFGAGDGSFYFYNPQTVSQGKTQFQRKWGRRTLEDDWRRRQKTFTTFNDSNEIPESLHEEGLQEEIDKLEGELPPVVSDDPKTREYYIQQLPLTEEDMAASNLIIADGLYNMAMIYKDKLEDMPLAVEAFEELERRFPANENQLESYYQIYLMALRAQDTPLADRYKGKIIAAFPESDYAVAIADPDYEYNIRTMDAVQDSVYQLTYDSYLAGDTNRVRYNYQYINDKYPLANLLPKYMFLNALTYVQSGNAEGFKEALKELLEKYPNADVSTLAGEMLKGVLRGRTLVQGNFRGMSWNLRFGVGEDGLLSATDSARVFTDDIHTPYRLLMMYPAGSLDRNQLLYAVAAYNFSNFMVKEFDMEFEEAGTMEVLAINGFNSIVEILHYYKMIYEEDGYAQALDRYITFLPISVDNYETLMRGKTLEEYIYFFEEAFGERAPELVARLITRMDAEEEEAPEEDPGFPDKTEEEIGEEQPEVIPAVPKELSEPEEEPAIPESMEDEEEKLPAEITEDVKIEEILGLSLDSVEVVPVAPPVEETGLTFKEIEEIRKREAAEEAARKEEARILKEEEERLKKELQVQKEKEREELLKKQKEEEAALLKAKAEQEKQRAAERKSKQKQAEADRKAKIKAQEQLRKQKEREYKQRLKEKEKERKQKEREYQQKLKQREAERKAAQKARESDSRKR